MANQRWSQYYPDLTKEEIKQYFLSIGVKEEDFLELNLSLENFVKSESDKKVNPELYLSLAKNISSLIYNENIEYEKAIKGINYLVSQYTELLPYLTKEIINHY